MAVIIGFMGILRNYVYTHRSEVRILYVLTSGSSFGVSLYVVTSQYTPRFWS